MTRFRRAFPIVALVLAVVAGCAPEDPRERILIERAKWDVAILSFAMSEDGKVTVSARISGPPSSDLQQLTVLVEMVDAGDVVVGSSWETLDLSGIQRGGPEDVFLRLQAPSDAVEGLRLSTVPDPTPEQMANLPELGAAG